MAGGPVGDGNYVVKDGDDMASIAAEHGFLRDTLWNLPENADLKKARKDPYILLPGDKVYIPKLREGDFSGPVDTQHNFVLKGNPEKLKVKLTDDDDKPRSGVPWVLLIDKTERFTGSTGGDGMIQQKIKPTAKQAVLTVGTGDDQKEYHINLGYVEPIEEIAGLQDRLLDLGFYDGRPNGKMDAQTRTALLMFQDKYQLPTTGENDDKTQAKLKDLFGS